MKAPVRFLILLILITSGINSYGQFAPLPTMPNYGAAMRPYIPPIRFNNTYYISQTDPSIKHDFTIVLQNDSTFQSRTKINIEEKTNSLEVKFNKEKKTIKPSDTKSISRITNEGKMLIGMPADSCWLFKIKFGKLSLYSPLAEEEVYYSIAFRQGENPVLPLTKETLLPYMKDDEKLVKLLDRKKFVDAVLKYNKKK